MRRALALAVLIASAAYLGREYRALHAPKTSSASTFASPEAGSILTPDERKRLRTSLNDPSPEVRLAAAQLLDALRDARDAEPPALAVLLKDPEPEVRAGALRALGEEQERRREEFRALAERLKRQYEEAVKRSAER